MKKPDVSSADYSLLQHSQLTTASAEKSFSVAQKLLSQNRNFDVENVKQYTIFHLNFCNFD